MIYNYLSLTSNLMRMKRKLHQAISECAINIGGNVKRIRIERDFTQQTLAFYADLERSTISNIERFNIDNITIRTLTKISLALDVKMIDLLQ